LISPLKKTLPIVALLFFGSITILLWRAQCHHEQNLIFHNLENALEQARIRINSMMNARKASLELMADRWVERTPPDFSRERFLSFAKLVFEHYPGFTQISWADPRGVVQWVFPQETGSETQDRKVFDHPDHRYGDAFETARRKRQSTVTPCIELWRGWGKGFEIIFPLVYDGELQGYLSGVFRVARIVDLAFPASIMESFEVSLYEGNDLVFRSGAQSDGVSEAERIHTVRPIEVGNRTWQLHMEPIHALYAPGSLGNIPFLAFGLILSATLALLLYLLLRRMEAYRMSRDLALHEVNERKLAEAALRNNEKKLESLLAELSNKNAELESFVYTISHDLKTPIVTIDGFIGALREDFGTVLPREAEKYLKYMSDAARKMEALINDLLDLSRIGRLTGKKADVSFADLVQDALETLQPQIVERGISLEIQPSLPVVYGERKRLGQVVYNLLNNAVKYVGRSNPAPRIGVGVEDRDGQKVFFVRDNGIGIEEKYYGKIFQIFERLPSAKQEEGTGIGLTIVKRIIEYHGGRVWLTSEPGKGTTFYFTIKDKEARHGS
jgi:signal transduction histidine kinase